MGDSYRDQISLQRRNNKGHTGVERQAAVRTAKQERDALRTAYFKAKQKGHTTAPAWRRLDA